jgi:hypothetical protein
MEVPGYERKKHDNPFGYNDDQLMEKQLALKNMKELMARCSNLLC